MNSDTYTPIFETIRGNTVESIHFGAVAVVDSSGELLYSHGDPYTVTFMRSSAKPFQALPLIEAGGKLKFGLSDPEIAIICGSHIGSNQHLETVRNLQNRTGIEEDQLLCGIHPPFHRETRHMLIKEGVDPTPNQHNCSGKHTGMLLYSKLLLMDEDQRDYLDFEHPVQKNIRAVFADICNIPPGEVELGVDGCSAPNFAVPLYNSALGIARLVDPIGGKVFPESRNKACITISRAMISTPEMVAGESRFDTRLMQVGEGAFISKGGAEGFLVVGILPRTGDLKSRGIGIAIKISDGDNQDRVRASTAIKLLKKMNLLTQERLSDLQEFNPDRPIKNWRGVKIGFMRSLID